MFEWRRLLKRQLRQFFGIDVPTNAGRSEASPVRSIEIVQKKSMMRIEPLIEEVRKMLPLRKQTDMVHCFTKAASSQWAIGFEVAQKRG